MPWLEMACERPLCLKLSRLYWPSAPTPTSPAWRCPRRAHPPWSPVTMQSPHLLPVPTPQVLKLPVLHLPHGLQFSLVGPAQALQLPGQVAQQLRPLLPLLPRTEGCWQGNGSGPHPPKATAPHTGRLGSGGRGPQWLSRASSLRRGEHGGAPGPPPRKPAPLSATEAGAGLRPTPSPSPSRNLPVLLSLFAVPREKRAH